MSPCQHPDAALERRGEDEWLCHGCLTEDDPSVSRRDRHQGEGEEPLSTTNQPGEPDPLRDIYRVSIIKAYNAARDPEVPLELVPEYVDAAAFFGERLGKTWDDVMNDCIDHSIAEMERDEHV